jgi:hypothetical protein
VSGGVEVRPEALDSPVARTLIADLNAELSRAYPSEQRFHVLAALGLYGSAGYARIPCFGVYTASRGSTCFGKLLAD